LAWLKSFWTIPRALSSRHWYTANSSFNFSYKNGLAVFRNLSR
jgi:hypothetical protein